MLESFSQPKEVKQICSLSGKADGVLSVPLYNFDSKMSTDLLLAMLRAAVRHALPVGLKEFL